MVQAWESSDDGERSGKRKEMRLLMIVFTIPRESVCVSTRISKSPVLVRALPVSERVVLVRA